MSAASAPDRKGRSGALAGLVAGLSLVLVPASVWAADAVSPVAPAPTPPAAARAVVVPLPEPAEPAEPAAPAPPARIRLPALGVDAPVAPVGVDDRGRMDVPLDIATVGWYRFGPGPGATAGSAVLSGHVDDREQGYGAFHRLADLAPGDPVTVDLADGGAVAYRVETVTRFRKADLPVTDVFARTGQPRLTLVTCGGPFDYTARGYTENVVVVARPDAP